MDERSAVFFTSAPQAEFLLNQPEPVSQGCWRIPLSLQALGYLLRRGDPHIFPHVDFVHFDECKRWYLDRGLCYSRNWLRELSLSFEVDGIDFAELDSPCQFLLFTHLAFIESTASRIVDAMPGVERFYVLQQNKPLPHEFYFDSDVSSAVVAAICERLGRRVEVVEMPDRPRHIYSAFASRPIMDTAPPDRTRVFEHGRGIRIGFAPATVAHAETIFESLRNAADSTVLFGSTWHQGRVLEGERLYRLSAADGEWSEGVARQLDSLFAEFRRRRNRSTLPAAIIRNPRMDFQFEYIFTRRWRAYANMIRRGRKLVRDLPLDLFVHSDHFTAESAVLSRLYRRRGARVLISLHSSYPCDKNWASWHKDDAAITPTRSAAARLAQISGMKQVAATGDPNLRSYRSIRAPHNTEQWAARRAAAAGNRKLVLVVTNALELDSVPLVDLRVHFESMAAMGGVANSLKDRVAFVLRTKPGWPVDERILYERLSGYLPDIDFDTPASFSDLVGIADCIVGVNIPTGGYYEILKSQVPLIHFQVADVVARHPDLPEQAITLANNPDELKAALESMLFDPASRAAAIRKQRDFANRDFMPDITADDPVSTVARALARKSLPRFEWLSGRRREPEGRKSSSWKPGPNGVGASLSRSAGSIDDILYRPGGRVKIIGWAADPEAGLPAKAVHVFLDSALIASGSPSLERPDVAAAYDKQSLFASGFIVACRVDSLDHLARLRVFAETHDDRMLELSRSF